MFGKEDSPKGGWLRNKWILLSFLCLTFLVYTVDRALLGPLAIPIQRDTGISDMQFGILNAAVFWAYAAVVPFAGLVGDRVDRVRLIGFVSVVWSVMTMLVGCATGFWSLLVLVSVAVTVPQAFYSPAAFALIAERHCSSRAIAMSSHQCAFYVGWLVSGVAVAVVLAVLGSWRHAYFIFGGLGLLVGLVFLKAGRSDAVRTVEAPVAHGARTPSAAQSFRAFFGCPSALLAAIGHVTFTFACFGYTSWGPKFIAQKFEVSPGVAGTGVMFWHFAVAFAAILLAGLLTDRLVGRFPRFRLVLQSAALLVAAPVLVLFGMSSTLVLVWSAAALFGLMKGLFEANSVNSLYDVIPSAYRASAIGYLNVLSGVFGSLAPMILGWLSQTKGTYGLEIGFASFGIVLIVACGLMMVSFLFTFSKDRVTE